LEELFINLRGAPLLLSPADWETARDWRRRGIPLDLVAAVLREAFEKNPEKKGRSGIRSLKYFDAAVERAWRQVRALGATEPDSEPEPLDLGIRLAALARSIPSRLSGSDGIRRRLLDLEGDAEDVEKALSRLDRELIALAEAALEDRVGQEIRDEVEAAVKRVSSRVAADEEDELRRRLLGTALRRRLGLPVLSLFSPEAAVSEPISEKSE
jgi:uncharacterized membrane protein YccC